MKNPDLQKSLLNKQDRNFDEVADHFANKVYGGLKGDIRLAVLKNDLLDKVARQAKSLDRPIRVLDIGAGLAQISIELAKLGHEVIVNDISQKMLDKAQQSLTAEEINTLNIRWIVCPFQALDEQLHSEDFEKFDLILCHAVLEWLAEPKTSVLFTQKWINAGGIFSLCFYNPASFTYRNLMMGNFKILEKTSFKSDNKKSLTPNNPVEKQDVFDWLNEHHFDIQKISGMRVFYDYTLHKRGGLENPDDVIAMEVKYSAEEPFKWMGRYLHVMSVANHST